MLKSRETAVMSGVCHAGTPSTFVKTCPAVPAVISPVPPDVTGRATPVLYVILIAGLTVGLVITTFRNEGTDADTVVTVPTVGYLHAGKIKGPATSIVSTCPASPGGSHSNSKRGPVIKILPGNPAEVRPVPPDVIGSGLSAVRVKASVPIFVIGEPVTVRNATAGLTLRGVLT